MNHLTPNVFYITYPGMDVTPKQGYKNISLMKCLLFGGNLIIDFSSIQHFLKVTGVIKKVTLNFIV